MKFPHSARLRFFRTEAGQCVRQLDRQRTIDQSAFNHRTVDTGGTFRTKCEFPPALVGKGIHFLLYDIGGIANRTDEETLVLKSGDTNLTKPVKPCSIQEQSFHKLPFITVTGEHVCRALN